MDTRKIAVIVAVAMIAVAGAAIYVTYDDDSEDTLKVAYLTKGYFPFIVGFERGMFDDLGFKVEPIIVTGSGQDAVNAVLARDAHMAATGDGPFVNTLGRNPGEIIGLCQYTQSEGYMGGHRWITHPDMAGIIPAIEKNESGKVTNGQAVADAIKAASAEGKGNGHGGMVTVGLVNGSTTHTMFMKWCKEFSITYTQKDEAADIQIKVFSNGGQIIEALAANQLNILGGSEPIPTNALNQVSGSFEIGDSSVIFGSSYSVLCTSKEQYDRHSEKMMKFLEALKEVNEWMEANLDEAARIIAPISGISEDSVKSSFQKTGHKVVWETDSLESWVSTADVNGFSLTEEDFIDACPHRDTINGWYA